jgi:transcriptional regulator with XRE-family HTH domain
MAKARSKNPFEAIRESLGLSAKEIGKMLGICHLTVMQTEQGLIKRPKAYAFALEEAGMISDAEELIEAHKHWLNELKQSKLKEFKAKIGTR